MKWFYLLIMALVLYFSERESLKGKGQKGGLSRKGKIGAAVVLFGVVIAVVVWLETRSPSSPPKKPTPAEIAAASQKKLDDQKKKAQTPAVKTPDVKTPVVKTPVVKTPDVKTPVVKTPVVKTPVVKTPVVKTPVVKTPAVKTPVVKTPDVKTPAVKTPAVKTPVVTTGAGAKRTFYESTHSDGYCPSSDTFPKGSNCASLTGSCYGIMSSADACDTDCSHRDDCTAWTYVTPECYRYKTINTGATEHDETSSGGAPKANKCYKKTIPVKTPVVTTGAGAKRTVYESTNSDGYCPSSDTFPKGSNCASLTGACYGIMSSAAACDTDCSHRDDCTAWTYVTPECYRYKTINTGATEHDETSSGGAPDANKCYKKTGRGSP
jgi:hypothetical protein